MPASTYLGNLALNSILRGVAFTVPARVWVSLHTADPGLTGVAEVTLAAWPSYLRRDPAGGGAVGTGFAAAAAKSTNNSLLMNYGAMDGAGSITITHFAIWDALTVGNELIYGPLNASKVLAPTDECVINPTKLTATVT